jgi:hypothetical protein
VQHIPYFPKTSTPSTAMKELHPSESAIGSHLDEQFDTATLPQQPREESRAGTWLRAHLPSLAPETPVSDADRRTEEAMHLDQ